MTCSLPTKLRLVIKLCLLIFLVFYKETAFGLGCLFWLHQGRIPRHTCRFHCCLAAHQRTKEMDSAGVPLLYPLDSNSSPWGYPLRRGTLAAAVYTNTDSLYPVLSLIASSEYCAAICVRLCIARISVGLLGCGRSFFIIGGMDCSCLRLRGVLLLLFVGFALTASRSFILADNGM